MKPPPRLARIRGGCASQAGDAAVKPSSGNEPLKGPRLDGASSYTNQSDIGVLFDEGA
jgi:hypothetical protein